MVSFKINIADPKTGKCFKTEVKDEQANSFTGLNIGEKIEGNKFGIEGYEFMLTGGTDYCGFPMRRGILGVRKKITIYPSTGFRSGLKGMKKRKTVCGHKINDNISAINLKVLKIGAKKLSEIFGTSEKEGKEHKPKEKAAEKKPEPPKETPQAKANVKEGKPEIKKGEKKPQENKPKENIKVQKSDEKKEVKQ